MIDLSQMEIFYYVATCHSFSKAAKELGVSKGYVSAQISALEKHTGIKLIHRTTRHLSLTAEGEVFLGACSNIVREKQLANDLLLASKLTPSGNLKVSAPPSICTTLLADLIPSFLEQYPQINLVIDSSAAIKNLVQHGIDVAVRIAPTPTENYVARLLGTVDFVTIATPHYLKRYDIPSSPEGLLQHNCLVYTADPAGNYWSYENESITVMGNLAATDAQIIKQGVLADLGIARLPRYIVSKELTQGQVIEVLQQYRSAGIPLYAQYNSQMPGAIKIRSFVDFLKKTLTM